MEVCTKQSNSNLKHFLIIYLFIQGCFIFITLFPLIALQGRYFFFLEENPKFGEADKFF